jgi:hypothetical protein
MPAGYHDHSLRQQRIWLFEARMHKPPARTLPAAANDALCCALESARVTSLGI